MNSHPTFPDLLLLAPALLRTDYMFVRISCTDLWCPLVTLSHRPNKTPGGGVGGGGSSYAQRKLSSLARRAAQQQQQQQPPQHQGELQFTLVMSMLTEFAKINDEVKLTATR